MITLEEILLFLVATRGGFIIGGDEGVDLAVGVDHRSAEEGGFKTVDNEVEDDDKAEED